ncbi:MAG: RusA family crossover junction endodeoxyribonuclease [Nitrospirales bacterium]
MRSIRIRSLSRLQPTRGKGGLVLLSRQPQRAKAGGNQQDWSNLGGDTLNPQELFLILPLPPSINHQYATVNGRRVLSSIGRHYKSAVGKHLSAILHQSPHRADFFEGLGSHAVTLSIRFYFKTALRRDLDGGLKIAQDAICQAISLNDNRITEIHLHKDSDAARPRMECTLALHHPLANKPKIIRQRLTTVPSTRR